MVECLLHLRFLLKANLRAGHLLAIRSPHSSGFFVIVAGLLFCIKGAVGEFQIPEGEDPTRDEFQFSWRFGNGSFGLLLLFGLVFTALLTRKARSWAYGTSEKADMQMSITGYILADQIGRSFVIEIFFSPTFLLNNFPFLEVY
jgi:hypothetical protein